MNAITKALFDISARIPKEILIEVFAPKTYLFRNSVIDYEEQIKNLVIRSRVMVDCDLVGGTEVFIPLSGCPSEAIDNDRLTAVYHIPKSKTQGRTITSVLSLSYVLGSNSTAAGALFRNCSISDTLVAGKAMFDAASTIPVPSTARVQLIGENTVMVKDTSYQPGQGILRCTLASDENFSHLQIKSYPAFSKLCELATKAYIYNNYAIKLDTAKLVGGQELGRFKEIVDSYSDAEEMYQTYLKETFQKVLFMNDREKYERFTKLMIGAFR